MASKPIVTENKCPLFPGITKRWCWPFPDPAEAGGSPEEKRAQVRRIRDAIRDWQAVPPEETFPLAKILGR